MVFSVTALVLYEYLLTHFSEIQLFWNGKFTGAVALFLANRYTTLVLILYQLALFLAPEPTSDTVRAVVLSVLCS